MVAFHLLRRVDYAYEITGNKFCSLVYKLVKRVLAVSAWFAPDYGACLVVNTVSVAADGFSVTFAQNGAWGFREALKGSFDLFIIDMVMPTMNGEEIVAKIKMEETIENTPIIMLSASVDKIVEKEVKSLGIESFFLKTQITPSELSKKVAEILSKK